MTRTPNPLVAWIAGIGLRGPGMTSWDQLRSILRGEAGYEPVPTVLVAPSALPATERRRVGKGVKIALDVGFAAVSHANGDASLLPSVFTSSSGDGDNCDAICRELTGDRMISPTRFHNSVHNAPAGYWSIAAHAMTPSTSLCAYNDSFIAGLDESMVQLATGVDAVLLVAYDAPYPEPLRTTRPTPDCFGIGLVLSRDPGPSAIARITFAPTESDRAATRMNDADLERCRAAIPAARALPLLDAVARRAPSDVVVEGTNGARYILRIDTFADDRVDLADAEPVRGATACV